MSGNSPMFLRYFIGFPGRWKEKIDYRKIVEVIYKLTTKIEKKEENN